MRSLPHIGAGAKGRFYRLEPKRAREQMQSAAQPRREVSSAFRRQAGQGVLQLLELHLEIGDGVCTDPP